MSCEECARNVNRDQQWIDLQERNAELERQNAGLQKELDELRGLLREKGSFEEEMEEESTVLQDHIRGPIFPIEIMLLIADYLYDTHARGTLGRLVSVCKSLNEEVNPIFFRRLVCDNYPGLDWDGYDKEKKRPIYKPLSELPRNKWQYVKEHYFCDLELGLSVYNDNKDGSSTKTAQPQIYYGDLFVCKPVKRESVEDFLQTPILWDADGVEGDFDECPVQVIDKITVDFYGDFPPSLTSRPMFHRTETPLSSFEIEFASGRTRGLGFGRTVEAAFEFVQPIWDDEIGKQLPSVMIKIHDGLEGLAKFVESLEVVLRRDLILDIHVEVEDRSKAWGKIEQLPDDDFREIMQSVSTIYRRCWPALKARWPMGFVDENFLFDVDVEFGLGSDWGMQLDTAKFSGYLIADAPTVIAGQDTFFASAYAKDPAHPDWNHSIWSQGFNHDGPIADDD